jgi:hypothetical protein
VIAFFVVAAVGAGIYVAADGSPDSD